MTASKLILPRCGRLSELLRTPQKGLCMPSAHAALA
jgi:hypothetical protein